MSKRHVYLKVASSRSNDFIVASDSGKPWNFHIERFDSVSDMRERIDQLWENGKNGMRCTRLEVEEMLGQDFEIVYKDDVEFCMSSSDAYTYYQEEV